MMAKVMARVTAIVMTTATVLWKEAIVPTMYDKLRVTTTCRQKNIICSCNMPLEHTEVFISKH